MNDLGQLVIVDLFCCGGGASEGYARAGFDVYGVDLVPVRAYPFSFARMDAVEFLTRLEAGETIIFDDGTELILDMVDGFAGSPPCQSHSVMRHRHAGKKWMDFLPQTREALNRIDKPYIIENVVGAPMIDSLILCGTMFNLGATGPDGVHRQLRRHRQFESNIVLVPPGPCKHNGRQSIGVYGRPVRYYEPWHHGYKGDVPEWREALGIDWLDATNLAQAIPPAYTEWLGRQLHAHIIEESYA